MALRLSAAVPLAMRRLPAAVRGVHDAAHGFHEAEIRDQLLRFPGGSIDVRKEEEGGIAVVTVNNPGRMNAFTGSMMVDLHDAVQQLERWPEGKGLLLHGANSTFCSGSDLNAVRALESSQDGLKMCMYMQNTLTRLMRLPLISVALVEGKALGGGAELTTACDFRLMVPGSQIRFVHRHMGLVPGWGGAARLVRLVGYRHALRLLSGAEAAGPQEALALGLADALLEPVSSPSSSTPDDDGGDGGAALRAALSWLEPRVAGAPEVVRAAKKVALSGAELPLEEALRAERDVFGTLWGAPANRRALARGAKHK
ncbi:ethylmalonyl-CoA decarboxylase [Petromyzon marinus]|uniref:ethylmalonyl-CoA decarboxylase n=1 Tax=Petromyzon marinus TaxID=7757 RepID=UPI003F711A03